MENDENTPETEQEENENSEEETNEEESSEEESKDQPESDDTDWKAEALKYKAILDRKKKKKAPTKTASKKSDDYDYGELAFLNTNDIKGSKEIAFTKKIQNQTGLELRDLINNNYFKAELNEFREGIATENATPSNSKRAKSSTANTVEYWIAKGELPKDRELRTKVVNARIKKEKEGGMFYNS